VTSVIVVLVTGLSIAGILALISLGLVLIMRATGTFNFAQGQFMLLPAIFAATLQTQDWPFWACILLGLAVGAAVAILFYRFVLQRTTGLNQIFPIIATLGLAEVIDGGMGLVFGTPSHSFRVPFLPSGRP